MEKLMETIWFGSVKTPHGELLVSVEAVNDAGRDLVLRVEVDVIPGFKIEDRRGLLNLTRMEGDMRRG